jgi:hypothetical protein
MKRRILKKLGILLAIPPMAWASGVLPPDPAFASYLIPVGEPNFYFPNAAFYCSVNYPGGGGNVSPGPVGDMNTDPCGQWAGPPGLVVKDVGLDTNNNWNIAQEWCADGAYWITGPSWGGAPAINLVGGWAAKTNPPGGGCWVDNTIGKTVRGVEGSPSSVPAYAGNSYWTAQDPDYVVPSGASAQPPFNGDKFLDNVSSALAAAGGPDGYSQPVGWQLALAPPFSATGPIPQMCKGSLTSSCILHKESGNVLGGGNGNWPSVPLPPKSTQNMPNPPIDPNRHFDSASMAKTISAVGMLAAFQQIQQTGNPEDLQLESPIAPVLKEIGWKVDPSLEAPGRTGECGGAPPCAPLTFRDLLQHTTPLCYTHQVKSNAVLNRNSQLPPNVEGDRYAFLKGLLESAPNPPDAPRVPGGTTSAWQPSNWAVDGTTFQPFSPPLGQNYCDSNYDLTRVLIPLILEGDRPFRNPDGTLMSDNQIDQLSSLIYRNFIRARLFAPLGITDADTFYTGPAGEPESVYFGYSGTAIGDGVNIGSSPCWNDPTNLNAVCTYDLTADGSAQKAGAGYWDLSSQEWTIFLNGLWSGRIIDDPGKLLTRYSLGAWPASISSGPSQGNTWSHNGGGWAGGPSSQWMTFPNGWTAALQMTSPTTFASGHSADLVTLLQDAYSNSFS